MLRELAMAAQQTPLERLVAILERAEASPAADRLERATVLVPIIVNRVLMAALASRPTEGPLCAATACAAPACGSRCAWMA